MPGTTKKDHQAERLQAIRLRYSINTHLEDRGITTPAAIGAATGLPTVEVVRLLTRQQWHEGDVTALKAIADRLGLDVPLEASACRCVRGGTHDYDAGPAPETAAPGPSVVADEEHGQSDLVLGSCCLPLR